MWAIGIIWYGAARCRSEKSAFVRRSASSTGFRRDQPGCRRIYSAITVSSESSKKMPASRNVALKSVFSMPRRVR